LKFEVEGLLFEVWSLKFDVVAPAGFLLLFYYPLNMIKAVQQAQLQTSNTKP
jgi:hypothetical protein